MDKEQLREWAQAISQKDSSTGRVSVDIASAKAAADYIKETLPEPTMDEIVWSDDKHLFAVARDGDGAEVVMLRYSHSGDTIFCINLVTKTAYWEWDDELTPTGGRYIRQVKHDGAQ